MFAFENYVKCQGANGSVAKFPLIDKKDIEFLSWEISLEGKRISFLLERSINNKLLSGFHSVHLGIDASWIFSTL